CCPEQVPKCENVRAAPTQPPSQDSPPLGSQVIVLPFQNPLPVVPRHQEGAYTCWATCAEMIMEFIGGVRVRQCVQTDRPFYGSRCCDSSLYLNFFDNCDSPSFPEFGRWGYSFQYSPSPLTWNQITNEFNGSRPFAFAWTRLNSVTGASLPISHMMTVIGYDEGNGQQTLVCLNPRAFANTI